MILVDTSVWIAHLQHANGTLSALLGSGQVLVHPFVIGELALGRLRSREAMLRDLHDLPPAVTATHEEVLHLIEGHRLFGQGIGLVDAHLVASARLMPGTALWTDDGRLRDVAESLGLAYRPST